MCHFYQIHPLPTTIWLMPINIVNYFNQQSSLIFTRTTWFSCRSRHMRVGHHLRAWVPNICHCTHFPLIPASFPRSMICWAVQPTKFNNMCVQCIGQVPSMQVSDCNSPKGRFHFRAHFFFFSSILNCIWVLTPNRMPTLQLSFCLQRSG